MAEVRHLLQRHNAALAGTNQVMRNFERKGQILIDAEGVDEDKLTELVLDAGAEDMSNEGGQFEILTAPSEYPTIAEKITAAGYTLGEDSGVNMVPTAWVPVTDKVAAEKLLGLVDALEELDDVQNVYMNGDIAEDAMPAEG